MSPWEKVVDLTQQEEYNEGLGYGHVTSRIKEKYNYLRIGELSNNFKVSGENEPTHLRVQVPKEGSYKAALTVIGGETREIINIFIQRRVCVIKNQILEPKEIKTYEFTVHVSSIIPDGYKRAYQGTGVDITVIGSQIRCLSLKVESATPIARLFMMGDSTMADQSAAYPYDPLGSYCGWGQMLPLFLTGDVTVSNHAHSGRNTLSFKEEGHFDIITSNLKRGDFVIMQFGHNDQKEKELMPYGGYLKELKKYSDEIKEKGAFPIIITPLSRNLWHGENHNFNDLLLDYAMSCKQIAKEEKVFLVDLHKRSKEWIIDKGPLEAMKYFYPGDFTHTNDYGGFEVARLVTLELQKLNTSLSPYIKEMPADTVQEAVLRKWERPSLEAFYRMTADWQLKNEWING